MALWPNDQDNWLLLGRRLSEGAELMRGGAVMDAETGLKYFTGYSYQTLYDWDQYFEAIAQFYFGWPPEYVRNGVEIFLHNQDPETGFIPRCVPVRTDERSEHVKPFLAQICCLIASYTGKRDWLSEQLYQGLVKYLQYWLDVKDKAGIGLSVWDSAPHSGMDNQHLLNPEEFRRPYPIPALAACEPGYSENLLPGDLGCNWRACTWIPTNYYTCLGLRRYGYNGEASELIDKTVRLIDRAGLREWYTSETGQGGGLDPFWGWTLTGLFLPLELEADFDPTTIPADSAGWAKVSGSASELMREAEINRHDV